MNRYSLYIKSAYLVVDIENAAQAYAERDQISRDIYAGATAMSKGVRALRKFKRQLAFRLGESTDQEVQEKGKQLNAKIDEWIVEILQKDIMTSQSNYQFEARLLIKFKAFLNSISNGNERVTQGIRDVSRDYLDDWNELKSQLQKIKSEDIPAINGILKSNGLPELYMPYRS